MKDYAKKPIVSKPKSKLIEYVEATVYTLSLAFVMWYCVISITN